MSCAESQPDFFNNVAAVASVLVFAKVVAHRSHDRETRTLKPKPWRAFFHGLGVFAAVVAVGVALAATEAQADDYLLHCLAWGGLAIAGLAFVCEIYADDVEPHLKAGQRLRELWRRHREKSVTDSAAV